MNNLMNFNSKVNVKWHFSFVILVIIISFLLRLSPAVYNEFWHDEQATYAFAANYSYSELLFHPPDDRPSFNYILMKPFVKIFDRINPDGRLFRVFPIIFSILTLIAIFLTCKKFLGDGVAIISLVYAGFHPVFIDFSWFIRDYSLLQLLSVISLYLYFDFSRKWFFKKRTVKLRFIVLNAFIVMIGSLTNFAFYSFIFALVSFQLILIIFTHLNKKQVRNFIIYLLSLIPSGLIGIYYFNTLRSYIPLVSSWIPYPTLANGLWVSLSLLGIGSLVTPVLATNFFILVLVMIVSIWILVVCKKCQSSWNKFLFFSFSWSIVFTFLSNLIVGEVLNVSLFLIKAFACITIPIVIIISTSIMTFAKKYKWGRIVVTTAVIFLVSLIVQKLESNPLVGKHNKFYQKDTEIVSLINGVFVPGDQVVVFPVYRRLFAFFWRLDPSKNSYYLVQSKIEQDTMNIPKDELKWNLETISGHRMYLVFDGTELGYDQKLIRKYEEICIERPKEIFRTYFYQVKMCTIL